MTSHPGASTVAEPVVMNAYEPEVSSVEPSPEEALDLRRLVADLMDYKWVALAVAALIFASVTFWTLSRPKVYEAVVSLEYDPTPPRPLGRAVDDPTAVPVMASYWANQEWYATQNAILASRYVAERVVEKLGLHQDPDFMGVPEARRREWQGASVSDAAAQLQQMILIEPVEDTRIVRVRAHDTDPSRAQLLVNTLAEVFVEKSIEDRLESTAKALDWLGKQLSQFRQKLTESELALHNFKTENNVLSVGLEDRQNIINRNIERYSAALADAKARAIALAARLAELEDANQEDPLQVNVSVVVDHPRVQALRAAYEEKEDELAALQVRYGERHPEVLALQRRMETIRSQLRQEIGAIIESVRRELAETRRTASGLEKELERLQEAGLRLNKLEIEYNRLVRERENNDKIYQIVLAKTTETDMAKALPIVHVRVLDRAVEPKMPIKPRVPLNLAAGGIAGLLFGLGFALLLSRMDRRLREPADVERLGVTLLGVVPRMQPEEDEDDEKKVSGGRRGPLGVPQAHPSRDMIVHTAPRSQVAEAVRAIRTNLLFMSVEKEVRTLLITSPNPREGKTTMTVNLAIALAQGGKRVVVVDTDLRRPRLHRIFDTENRAGASTVLIGESALDDVILRTSVEGLSIVTSGPIPPNPSELLHAGGFTEMLDALSDRFDVVICDSPPVNFVTDASVIAAQVDGAVLVVHANKTTRDELRMARRRLQEVGARLFGCVFNHLDRGRRSYDYNGYYVYGGYYGGEDDGEETSSAA